VGWRSTSRLLIPPHCCWWCSPQHSISAPRLPGDRYESRGSTLAERHCKKLVVSIRRSGHRVSLRHTCKRTPYRGTRRSVHQKPCSWDPQRLGLRYDVGAKGGQRIPGRPMTLLISCRVAFMIRAAPDPECVLNRNAPPHRRSVPKRTPALVGAGVIRRMGY
jgi:hypothetical protein